MNESLTPEIILNAEDEVEDVFNLNPTLRPILNIEKDLEHDTDVLLEDIYPEGRDDLRHKKWWEYFYYFRWFANFIFVGCPWTFMSSAMLILNVLLNITLNKWWGGGNWLLIFNTFYLTIQTFMSWPLVYEIPFYLSHLRIFRVVSGAVAVVYTAVYLFIIFDWIYQLYLEPTTVYEEYQFLDIVVNMYLAYNILFNLHLMPVNFVIMFKEIFLEIFPPMLNQNRGSQIDTKDLEDTVNPQSYVNVITHGELPDENDHRQNENKKYIR
jgi:hypothetical protein